MFNRIIRATRDVAGAQSATSTTAAFFARTNARGFITTVQHMFMILGIAVVGVLTMVTARPYVSDRLLFPFSQANAAERPSAAAATAAAPAAAVLAATAQPAPHAANDASFAANDVIEARRFGIIQNAMRNADKAAIAATSPNLAAGMGDASLHAAANSREQALVTTWLARKYRLAGDATNMLVSAAYVTAKDIKLDPLLILSVVAIESGFNPFAESPLGAQGLMQVMSKIHHEKFQRLGGVKAALNPVANIKVGSSILKDYVNRGGSVEAGLKMYVGASAFDNDAGYGSKVLAEYRRLKEVATGKNVPLTSSTASTYNARSKHAEPATPSQPAATPAATNPVLSAPADPVANAGASMAAL